MPARVNRRAILAGAWLLAAYFAESQASAKERDAVLAEVARIVVEMA